MAIEGERKQWIISALRRASYRWYPRDEAKKQARVERGKYLCAICKGIFGPKFIALDHIDPIVPVTGWDSWEGYVDRLFGDVGHYQVLCKECHKIKTRLENETRRANEAKKNVPKTKRTRKVRSK